MPQVSSSVSAFPARQRSLIRLNPSQALVLANAISLSRGLLAVLLFACGFAGVSPAVLVFLAAVMWTTDWLDGVVARYGHRRGARPRDDGAALDPLIDDLAFVSASFVLLELGGIPLWFVAALLASRVLFMLVRITGVLNGKAFAAAEPLTKLSGFILAVGQVALLARIAWPESAFAASVSEASVVAVMTTVLTASVIHFAVIRHGRSLVFLLRR